MVVIPNEEQIMWMMANADDTHAPAIVISCILCGVLSLVFVLLRLYSRFITKVGMQTSDWLVVVALIFSFALDASLACTTLFGNGRHVIFVTDHRMLAILTITDEIFYGFSITFIKLGVLALYMNLFPPTRFRYAIWAAVAMVSGWMISLFFAAIFHCNPIAYNWDQTIEGAYCIDGGIASSAFGIANIATDFVILLLPIPSVIALKLSRQKKILAIFTFVMGGSACIISIVRVPYTLWLGASWDITYDQYHAAILTSTELTAGILVTSIPTYLPLIRKCTGRSFDRTNSNQNRRPLQGFGFNGLATIGSSGFRQKSSDSDKSAGHSSVTMAVIDVELATHGLIPDETDSTYKKKSKEQLHKTSENPSDHSR